jgi:NAD dependent epimerase/dehydratase
MKISGKKVLVTGADGFIGSHLAEGLVEAGAEVTAFVLYNSFNRIGNLEYVDPKVLRKIKLVAGDITDLELVMNAVKGQELVFHLAALIAIPYSYTASSSYLMTDVLGTLNILKACREHGVEKVVHTSTSETYGTAQYTPIDENHPLQAQSPYAATKIAGDKLAESFHCSFNLPVATIRPFNTYGPRQSARAVIPTVICQALAGKKEIKLGSLTPVRDLNYVKDTVSGFIKIAESPETVGKVLNVGSGRGVTIGELAKKILELVGSKAKIVCDQARVRPEKSEVMTLLCDYSRAKKMIGYEPQYSLEEGLKETIEFINNHLDRYRPEEYNI